MTLDAYTDLARYGSKQRIEAIYETPTISLPNEPGGYLTYEPGKRSRLVIEGERELVQRVAAAAMPIVEQIVKELNS